MSSCEAIPPAQQAGSRQVANQWGFAIYRTSQEDYENSYLPTGSMGGTAEDALDTACGLYLAAAPDGGPVRQEALRQLEGWHARARDPLAGRSTQFAYRTAIRTLEGIVADDEGTD